jgi:hypothetical protein
VADLTTSAVAAALVTNRHARAALGIAAQHIRNGFDILDSITESSLPIVAQLLSLAETSSDVDVKETGRELLDRTNLNAQAVYGAIPDTDDPLDAYTRGRVGVALENARSDLELLESVRADLSTDFLSDLGDLLSKLADGSQAALRFVASAAKQIVGTIVPTWVWFVLGGAAIVGGGIYAYQVSKRGLLRTAIGGGVP